MISKPWPLERESSVGVAVRQVDAVPQAMKAAEPPEVVYVAIPSDMLQIHPVISLEVRTPVFPSVVMLPVRVHPFSKAG